MKNKILIIIEGNYLLSPSFIQKFVDEVERIVKETSGRDMKTDRVKIVFETNRRDDIEVVPFGDVGDDHMFTVTSND